MPQLGVRGQAPGQLRILHSSSVLCCAGAADLQPHQGESQGRPHPRRQGGHRLHPDLPPAGGVPGARGESIYTLSTHCLHTVYTISKHYLLTIYTLSKHYLLAIYSLSKHYLHTIYSLSTRQVGTWITVIWNHKNGQTFFPMFEKRAGAWFAWIFMLTNPEEAGKQKQCKHLKTSYTSL